MTSLKFPFSKNKTKNSKKKSLNVRKLSLTALKLQNLKDKMGEDEGLPSNHDIGLRHVILPEEEEEGWARRGGGEMERRRGKEGRHFYDQVPR